MSSDTDGFELVSKQATRREAPRLTVYSSGDGYVNQAAVDRYFEEVPAVRQYVDRDAGRLAFEAAEELDNVETYSLTHNKSGADVSVKTALRRLGVDVDDLEDTHFFDIEEAGDLVVVDLSALLDSDTESEAPDDVGTGTTTASNDDTEPDTETQPAASSVSVQDRLTNHLRETVAPGEAITTSAGDLGDEIGADGRAIAPALKNLGPQWQVERTNRTAPNGAMLWAVRRLKARSDDDADSDQTDSDDRPSKAEIQFWCGRCGEGPFDKPVHVEGHHSRRSHDGEPIIRAIEPTDAELLGTDSEVEVSDAPIPQRVEAFLAEATPEARFFKTEDIALAIDAAGNLVERTLNDLDGDGWEITRDGRLWRVDPVDGGDA